MPGRILQLTLVLRITEGNPRARHDIGANPTVRLYLGANPRARHDIGATPYVRHYLGGNTQYCS